MPGRMLGARGGGSAEVAVADSPLATFESLTQAAIIACMGVAIVVSNLLIIAAFLNFKGNTKNISEENIDMVTFFGGIKNAYSVCR